MTDVVPVVFKNYNNLNLFGMLHIPKSGYKQDIAIVLLSPGVKMRVAPHRLYLTMTQHFLELGFSVFRFDFNGLGDSEGDIEEEFLADFYNTVALGRYKEDTKAAIDWLENEYDISKFILAGLCGGALTGLLVGSEDNRVEGLLALGIPCVLEASQSDKAKYITINQLKELRAGYIKNLFRFKSWLRLLTFKSNFRVLFKSILQSVISGRKDKNSITHEPSQADKQQESNVNPLFVPAFFNMLDSSKKMILIFSGADRLGWEYEEKFAEPYEGQLKKYSLLYEVHTVPNANHIFSNKEWQKEMLQYTCDWLEKYYSQRPDLTS